MKEEKEVYDKVRRTMVTEGVTEKKGGVAFGLTFVSEEAPKMPPRRLMELKKEDPEKWRGKLEQTTSIVLKCLIISQLIRELIFLFLFISFFLTENQGKTLARKQMLAQQKREEARIQKQIEKAHKEMERLEKYVNLGVD